MDETVSNLAGRTSIQVLKDLFQSNLLNTTTCRQLTPQKLVQAMMHEWHNFNIQKKHKSRHQATKFLDDNKILFGVNLYSKLIKCSNDGWSSRNTLSENWKQEPIPEELQQMKDLDQDDDSSPAMGSQWYSQDKKRVSSLASEAENSRVNNFFSENNLGVATFRRHG